MTRRPTVPSAVVLALVGLIVSTSAAHAQTLPPQLPSGLLQLLNDPAAFATSLFNTALTSIGRDLTDRIMSFLDWLLSGTNVIGQTPPSLSYDSGVVQRLWGALRGVANVGLGVVAVFGGFNLIVHPHIRAPYHGALELVPRLLVGGVLVNTSLSWGRFAIDLNNALASAVGSPFIPGWSALHSANPGNVLLDLIAVAIYLFMGVLLLGQMLMRLALVDALLIVAPIALLCWVLPQTQSWSRLWFTTFFGTVFVQFIQVVVLQLGSELVQGLAAALPSVATNPLMQGREWLASLLLGVAVLQLARRVPRLMPGYPSVGSDSLGPLRMLASRQLISSLVGPMTGKVEALSVPRMALELLLDDAAPDVLRLVYGIGGAILLALLLALAIPLALVGALLPSAHPLAEIQLLAPGPARAGTPPDELAELPVPPVPVGAGPVEVARRYLGVPYVFGGTNPAVGLDCSGLVQLVYRQLGVALPRTAQQQYGATVRVSREQLQPGDLVFFARTYADPNDWITHVGIYAGGGQQINAPTTGQVVSIQAVFSGFWGAHFAGAGRVVRD